MLKTIEQHNDEIRKKLREEEEKDIYRTGIKCPDCNVELRYIPYSILKGHPAQRGVHCINCGLKTKILVE